MNYQVAQPTPRLMTLFQVFEPLQELTGKSLLMIQKTLSFLLTSSPPDMFGGSRTKLICLFIHSDGTLETSAAIDNLVALDWDQ